ncbi:MAG: hypothetical protein WBG86_09885 [Polyangiales bacterium]
MTGKVTSGLAWIACVAMSTSPAVAQDSIETEELVVAVPGIRALHGDDDIAHEFAGWLRAGTSAIEGWKLHTTIVSLEQLMLVSGCDSPDEACLSRIAETLGADRVISGSLSRVDADDGYETELFLFHADTGQIEAMSVAVLDRNSVRPEDLAVIGQQQVSSLADKPLDQLGQEQAAELQLSRDGAPPIDMLAAEEQTEKRFPIWPALTSYAGAAAFVGLTAWSWVTLRNVQGDRSFEVARAIAGPDVANVCRADTNFGIEELDSLCSKANTHESLQWVFLGMSAASIGVGTWLLVKSLRSGRTSDRARLTVTPIAGRRAGGFSARLRF